MIITTRFRTLRAYVQDQLLAFGARHLSEHTVKDYVNTFYKFITFLGEDIPVGDIMHKHIECSSLDEYLLKASISFLSDVRNYPIGHPPNLTGLGNNKITGGMLSFDPENWRSLVCTYTIG